MCGGVHKGLRGEAILSILRVTAILGGVPIVQCPEGVKGQVPGGRVTEGCVELAAVEVMERGMERKEGSERGGGGNMAGSYAISVAHPLRGMLSACNVRPLQLV